MFGSNKKIKIVLGICLLITLFLVVFKSQFSIIFEKRTARNNNFLLSPTEMEEKFCTDDSHNQALIILDKAITQYKNIYRETQFFYNIGLKKSSEHGGKLKAEALKEIEHFLKLNEPFFLEYSKLFDLSSVSLLRENLVSVIIDLKRRDYARFICIH